MSTTMPDGPANAGGSGASDAPATSAAPVAPVAPVADSGLDGLSQRIGHRFADPELLRRAMAHRSWCAEHPGNESNERLEFLGDAVLGWMIADIAYREHQDLPEGKLTDLRKSVVNASALAEVAVGIDLGPCLLLGKGESAAGGRMKPSILSDALEAVIGAVYLDGGVVAAARLIEHLFTEPLQRAAQQLDRLDHKTLLQELTARMFDTAPVYVISETGPDHQKTFTAGVVVGGRSVGQGTGRSKKLAEQAAALAAYTLLSAEA
ncbi:MAG: ribonuclease III [Actinobacteria bacterium]|jgi:ribonuclease-3|uniref:ribonuclease III n=1 Tax=freshwater metagenome TaxID=449393 RepID=A0A6J6DF89_9ZZZZ|nr:ribonuclease III [Actinomycetota bacterium]